MMRVVVRDSFNVASLTDNDTRRLYTNFTNNMNNAHYSAGGLGS